MPKAPASTYKGKFEMAVIPGTMTPNGGEVCPEHNVPVDHARRSYGCRCGACRRPGERDPSEPDPHAEALAEKKRREAEARSAEIREATSMTYKSDAALRDRNTELYASGLEPAPSSGEGGESVD